MKSLSHIRLFATPWTSLPGSSVHGILQARVLEWVAISFSMVIWYIHCNLHAWLYSTYTVIYMLGYTVHTLWSIRLIIQYIHWFTHVVIWYMHCDLHALLHSTYTVIYMCGYMVHTLKWEDLMVIRYIHCDLHAWLHGTYTVIYTLGYMVHTL